MNAKINNFSLCTKLPDVSDSLFEHGDCVLYIESVIFGFR